MKNTEHIVKRQLNDKKNVFKMLLQLSLLLDLQISIITIIEMLPTPITKLLHT